MSGVQFTNLIRNRIHECAPDDSIETITVGTLRRAADDMEGLYEALDHLRSYGCPICSGDCASANPPVAACPIRQASIALAKARGETA